MYRFLLTIIMVFLCAHIQCQEHEGAGVIISGPVTKIVAPGDKTHFRCHARGDLVFWQIDKICPYIEKSEFEARGFHFSYEVTEKEEHNNTMTVEAHLSNNNTLISCTVLGWSNGELVQYAFQEGYLIIAGSPLAPFVDLNVKHVNSDTFIFSLNWSTPFTWSSFPIISYKIIFTNYSNAVLNTTIDVVKGNDTGLSYHQIEYFGRGSDCHVLTFSIEANNSLGKGESTLVHSGQPKNLEEIGDIKIAVTLLSNGAPHVWMSFLAPSICVGYQNGVYNITIYDDNGLVVKQFGPTQYKQESDGERTLIVRGIRSGLVLGKEYEVEVTVKSIGIFRSQRKNFIYNSLSHTGTVAPHLPHPVTHDSKQVATVGAIVGAVFLIFTCILFIIVIVHVVFCYRRKKKTEFDSPDGHPFPNRRRARVSTCKMEINPIYEGVVYETTPGESFKPLLNGPSRVCTTTTEYYPCYGRAGPSLPPPRTQLLSCSELDLSDDVKGVATTGSGNQYVYKHCGDNDNHLIKGQGNTTAESMADGKVWSSNQNTYECFTIDKGDKEEKYMTL